MTPCNFIFRRTTMEKFLPYIIAGAVVLAAVLALLTARFIRNAHRKKLGIDGEKQVAAKLQLRGISVSREMLSQMERDRCNIKVSILLALKEIYRASFEDIFKDLP